MKRLCLWLMNKLAYYPIIQPLIVGFDYVGRYPYFTQLCFFCITYSIIFKVEWMESDDLAYKSRSCLSN